MAYQIEHSNIIETLAMKRGGSVYIMTYKGKTTLYVGVTSDLQMRIQQHKQHSFQGSFTEDTCLGIASIKKTFQPLKRLLTENKK